MMLDRKLRTSTGVIAIASVSAGSAIERSRSMIVCPNPLTGNQPVGQRDDDEQHDADPVDWHSQHDQCAASDGLVGEAVASVAR